MDIPCPEKFDFIVERWPAWKQRFLRFRAASDLSSKPEIRQINMLIYCMGDKADIVFQSFHMSDEQSQSFNAVLDRFDKHFVAI